MLEAILWQNLWYQSLVTTPPPFRTRNFPKITSHGGEQADFD